MLNLKKVMLGTLASSILTSSLFAAYVECPQSGWGPQNKFYNKDWKIKYDAEFMTSDGRIFSSWGNYKVPYESCPGGDNDGCTTSYKDVYAGYKEILYGSVILELCSAPYKQYWSSYKCESSMIKCVLKKGSIDSNNAETDALKAKVQALESKVYSCVQ